MSFMFNRSLCLFLLLVAPLSVQAQTVFMVQLGTYESQEAAQKRWQDLSGNFPDIFSGLKYTPDEFVRHPDTAVSYRTQAGPIASREEAESICATLAQGNGGECYVAETAMFSSNDAEVTTAAVTPVQQPVAAVATAPAAVAQPIAQPVGVPIPVPATPMQASASNLPAGYVPSAVATPQNPVTTPQQFVDPYAVQDAAPTTAYVPQGTENAGTVAVQEAIPVPLSEPVANPYLERDNRLANASPSDSSRISSLWADIGFFRSETAALQYVHTLKVRDNLLPRTLRIRITRPYGNTSAEGQYLSLRMGPFVTTVPVRRICALTRPENLRCRAVKDLGGSVQNTNRYAARQPVNRGQLNNQGVSSYQQYRQNVRSRAPIAMSGTTVGGGAATEGYYRVQLGSFLSPGAAQGKWSELLARHGDALRSVGNDISAPQGSTGGRLFRLRTAALPDFVTANNLCNRLKAQGTLCIVVK
jgi:SPOR domain